MLKEYLEFGGFPRVVLETRENKKALLDEYFEAIVLRDVAARYNVRETGLLRAFATVLLNNSSSPVSIARLAGILQESFKQRISLETVSRFLAYTESAFLAFLVPIFSYKIKEQMRYPRKAYCIDTGMRNAVSFRFSQDMGRLYENLVFLELNRMGLDIYYWKDRQGREVDFVIKNGTKVREAVQVCFDASKAETRKREVRALMKCMDEFRLKEGLIITETEDEEDNIGGKKIIFRPLWKWIMQHR